jgi:hypothetical protein
MPLDDHLLRNEQILASAKAASGGFLYATNQRVIKYDKGLLREKVQSLSYSHIVAVSYEKQSLLGALVAGIVSIIVGILLYTIIPAGLRKEFPLGIIFDILCLVLVLVGIYAIAQFVVLTLLGKVPQFYEIKAVGLSDSERQSWRTAGAETGAKTFARFIQDQISTREIQTPQPP